MRRRAFTLPEILVVLALLALLVGAAVVSLRSAGSRTGSRALAELLAEELRSARIRAIATQTPVALVVPASHPSASAVYRLEGETLPKITRHVDFRGEAPGCHIFVGLWPTSAPTTLAKPGKGIKGNDFPLADWLPAGLRDYVFLFTPSGGLIGNDLPVFDNEYHLVVCAGLETRGAVPPGPPALAVSPPYYQLERVSQPVTLALNAEGAIRLESGLLGSDGSTQVVAGLRQPTLASGVQRYASANRDPQLKSVTLLPLPKPDLLAAGVDCNVAPGGFVSLQVEAEDPDGDALSCEWSATPLSGSQAGVFCVRSGEVSQQVWDPALRRYQANWEWKPPVGAVAGDKFRLTCTVRDGRGGSATASGTFLKTIEVVERGSLVFVVNNTDIYRMNADGSEQRRLTRLPGLNFGPSFSADGTKVAFASFQAGRFNIYMMNADGSDLHPLLTDATNTTLSNMEPVFAPTGDELLYLSRPAPGVGALDLKRLGLDGQGSTVVANIGRDGRASYSPDGQRIAYDAQNGGIYDLYLVNADGNPASRVRLTNGPPGSRSWFPSFHPDGSGLMFVAGNGANSNLYYMDLTDPSHPINPVTTDTSAKIDPCFSPSGTQVVWAGNSTTDKELHVADFDPASHTLSNMRALTHQPGRQHTHPQWRP